jgi:hypothetical protein
MNPVTINCDAPDWQVSLLAHLNEHEEVDLINFDFMTNGKPCEQLAARFSMKVEFRGSLSQRSAHFRKIAT